MYEENLPLDGGDLQDASSQPYTPSQSYVPSQLYGPSHSYAPFNIHDELFDLPGPYYTWSEGSPPRLRQCFEGLGQDAFRSTSNQGGDSQLQLGENVASGPTDLRPCGYLFINKLGVFPYFTYQDSRFLSNHLLLGYLQREREDAALNLNDGVYHYYGNIEELGSFHPLMRELKAFLKGEVPFSNIRPDLTIIGEAESFSFKTVLLAHSIDRTTTMDYQDLVSRISAMTLDPAQQYLLHDSEGRIHQDAGPTILLDGGENEEEEEEEEEILQDQKPDIKGKGRKFSSNSMYCVGQPGVIKRSSLNQVAPNVYTIIHDTGYYFQATFIQGLDIPFLWLEKSASSRSRSERDREYGTLFEDAWTSSLSLNPSLTPETRYYDEEEKAFLSLTRERYFPHVLDKRARIGKSLDEFVKARLTRLLKDLGNEEFLGLFGPLEDQVDFQDHSNGAMKTLLGPIPGFPNSFYPFQQAYFVAFLRDIFYGPMPFSLVRRSKKRSQNQKTVASNVFSNNITDDIIAFVAAS
ncbi:hypothetical protein K443DRAFT_126664, partial [Laccaria amethystina LaAM-08-1]